MDLRFAVVVCVKWLEIRIFGSVVVLQTCNYRFGQQE